MPSRFSSQGSKDDAAELAAALGCRYETLPIEGTFTAFLAALEGVFEGRPFDSAEENLQARIRGTLLMAYANKFNSMLLTTGNKSELAMGYCTLYGDTNGALGPIGDLFKTEVFALCGRINEREREAGRKGIIPQAILDKPPSAELRPNQKDEDSLPPYEELDEILRLYLFGNLSADEIAARGKNRELAERIINAAARAEFKRRQAPPVLKVSPRAFGMGRRMPIARYVYEISPGPTPCRFGRKSRAHCFARVFWAGPAHANRALCLRNLAGPNAAPPWPEKPRSMFRARFLGGAGGCRLPGRYTNFSWASSPAGPLPVPEFPPTRNPAATGKAPSAISVVVPPDYRNPRFVLPVSACPGYQQTGACSVRVLFFAAFLLRPVFGQARALPEERHREEAVPQNS
jgi:NAD+ synthetase